MSSTLLEMISRKRILPSYLTRNIDLRIKRYFKSPEKSLGCPYLNEGLRESKLGNLDVGPGLVAGGGGLDDGAILVNGHLPPLPALAQHQNPPCLLWNNPSFIFSYLYLHVQFSIKGCGYTRPDGYVWKVWVGSYFTMVHF